MLTKSINEILNNLGRLEEYEGDPNASNRIYSIMGGEE